MSSGRRGAGLVAVMVALAAVPPLGAAAVAPESPDFVVHTNSFAFDHAPTFAPDDQHVLFHHDHPSDGMQIYVAKLDGSQLRCVTCGVQGVSAPNMVPSYRPEGDKILFHTWTGHQIHFGAPGFGGVGSTFWVINPDGTHPVNLVPPELGTEGMDNFHAYFSPDGKHIAWAHIDWNFVTPLMGNPPAPGSGTGKWSVYIADYVDDTHGPHLVNVRQVRPENGHFYETQWWSPDGKGFLFTESSDEAVSLDLYYYEVATGHINRLTQNHTWTEQAIFTPDGKKVIYMSIKDHQNTWGAWSTFAHATGLAPQYDYVVLIPLFFSIFVTPGYPPACDLYEIDLATGHERRLTHDGDDGWIIPELAYDFGGKRLMWTELEVHKGLRVEQAPSAQPGSEQYLVQNPPIPTSDSFASGNESFYITWQTRIGQYVAGASTALTGPTASQTPSLPFSGTGAPIVELVLLCGLVAAGLFLATSRGRVHRRSPASPDAR